LFLFSKELVVHTVDFFSEKKLQQMRVVQGTQQQQQQHLQH
jgi:hypothetical protein